MVNIADAKTKLSEYLEAVDRGETVIICRHNRPVAELRSVAAPRVGPRDLAPMFPGETFVTDAFFEPMSEREIEDWYGPDVAPANRVAERPFGYGETAPRPRRKRTRRS